LTAAAIKKVLRESSLFKDLSNEERGKIFKLSRQVTFESGDFLCREGDLAEEIYIVARGTVAVEVGLIGRQRRRRATIETVRRGESVGWSAGVGLEKYITSAQAVEKTTVVAVNGAAVRRLFEEDTSVGLRVTRKLVNLARSRLTHTTEKLANILSVASHDLKAPLAAVQSFHQVILGGYAGEITEQQKNYLLRSGERIKGLLSMIDDISDLSRLESYEMEKQAVSLVRIAEASLEDVRQHAAEKGIDLVEDWATDLPTVWGDPIRLQQAMTHLLRNAVKFSLSGGKVTLRVTDDREGRMTGEREKVMRWLENARAFFETNGKDIALAEFSSPRGRFVKDQLYIFALDLNGVMLAHGVNQNYIGKNFIDLKDSEGVSLVREIVDTAKAKGSGWAEYRWYDLVTKEERPKIAYLEEIDDVIICSGMFQDIVVEVLDNGTGIPEEDLPRIFDDFYRGKDAPAGGAGVGLSIVRRIVEAHGGRIWAESPYPGSKRGAKFTFTLPKVIMKPNTAEERKMSAHESRN
jgi:cytochrome c